MVAKMLLDECEKLKRGKGNAAAGRRALRRFVSRTAMLRDCGFKHIGVVLVTILRGPSDSIADDASEVDPEPEVISEEITEAEAIDIGGAFAPSLANHDTAAAAVAAYIEKYVALRKLSERHVWFRPMLETIAGRLKDFDVPHSAIRRSTFRRSILSHPVRVAPISGGDESGASGAPVRPYPS